MLSNSVNNQRQSTLYSSAAALSANVRSWPATAVVCPLSDLVPLARLFDS